MEPTTLTLAGTAIIATSKGLNKLAESLPSAIGKLYEPIHKVRMAKAEKKSISIISEAMRENIDMPVTYKDGTVEIISTDIKSLLDRAQNRFVYEQLQKQQNIEMVLNNTCEELENEEDVSDEPVEPDWLFRFFNAVQDISNEDMQKLWGKVLAGEIKQPKSFSFRTLETLKNLTVKEAKLFEKLSLVAIKSGKNILLFEDFKGKYFSFEELLTLAECGLLHSPTANLELKIKYEQNINLLKGNENVLILLQGKENKTSYETRYLTYNFSNSACQLFEILDAQMSDKIIIEYAKAIKKHNSQINVSVHKIISETETSIEYGNENLLDIDV